MGLQCRRHIFSLFLHTCLTHSWNDLGFFLSLSAGYWEHFIGCKWAEKNQESEQSVHVASLCYLNLPKPNLICTTPILQWVVATVTKTCDRMCLTFPDLRLPILAKWELHPLPALPWGILVPPLVPRVKHLYKYCQGDSPTVYILINQSGPAVSLNWLSNDTWQQSLQLLFPPCHSKARNITPVITPPSQSTTEERVSSHNDIAFYLTSKFSWI